MEKEKLIHLAVKCLKALFIILCVAIALIIIYIAKEIKLVKIIQYIIGILSPVFFGFLIAWLFDPLVGFLTKKKISRFVATIIVYLLIILFFVFIINIFLPVLYDQIKDFANLSPKLLDTGKSNLDMIIKHFTSRFHLDFENIRTIVYKTIISNFSKVSNFNPDFVLNVVKSLLKTSIESFLSFIIGFYILIDLPNIRSRARKLIKGKRTVFIVKTIKELEDTFRQYVKSTFIVVILLCICQSLAFKISGLPSPLAFGFFCAFTNMIQYIGPYIGGIPAVVVGFTISPSVGVASLISVILCQFIESYLITPNIMSKTMKLHPVLIILGLSVGATFGIVGMIFATPIMACLRVIYLSVKGEFKWKSF